MRGGLEDYDAAGRVCGRGWHAMRAGLVVNNFPTPNFDYDKFHESFD